MSDATFYTVANDRFFPGVVALLNSLRLADNDGELVVLDFGLAADQRRRLEAHARVVETSGEIAGNPILLKPAAHLLDPDGVVVVIDSDIIVTRSLADVIAAARVGGVCVFTDDREAQRRFSEWEEIFGLPSSPRPQRSVNSGFLAFSTEHWPHLLGRWWEACRAIPRERTRAGGADYSDPLWDGDQDALNALLMTVVPPEALIVRSQQTGDALLDVEVVDARTLFCLHEGKATELLHDAGSPKPWQEEAWMRVRRNAYVRLLPRLFFGGDVAVRLSPEEVPVWLRPRPGGRIALAALSAMNRAVRQVVRRTPQPVYSKLRRFRPRPVHER